MLPPSEAPPRDRPFDGFRVPASGKARELIAQAVRLIGDHESRHGWRTLARSPRNRRTFEATVRAVMSDLAVHACSGHGGRVAIPLSNQKLSRKSRYRPLALNEGLRDVLKAMVALGIVNMVKGWHDLAPRPDRERYRQTTIVAGQALRSWIERDSIGLADFGRDEAEEVILLKGVKPKRGEEAPPHVEPRAPLVEYDDSSPDHPAHGYRRDVRTLNAWIGSADLAFAPGFPSELLRYDLTQRTLKRHFTRRRFDSGGRLFGGTWQTIERRHREWLRVDGQRGVVLDYQAAFVNLAYARMGVQPQGDPYTIPGLEAHRRGVQKLMQASLFQYRTTGRVPQGTRRLLPAGVPLEDLMRRIMAHHQPIQHMLRSEPGHSLMFEESEIIIACLLRLMGEGVHALPLHDALWVPASARELVRSVMLETYLGRTGQTIVVCDDGDDDDDGGGAPRRRGRLGGL